MTGGTAPGGPNCVSPPQFLCTGCGVVSNRSSTDRLPKNWKNLNEQQYCGLCWRDRYRLRTLLAPVVSGSQSTELRNALLRMWDAATRAANWMMAELYSADVRTVAGQSKLIPMQRVYLYPEARRRFPELPSRTVATLEHAVQAKYRAVRYQVVWANSQAIPTYRYPAPYVVPNQAWSAALDDAGRPTVSVRIGDQRWALRLRGGPRFRYHRQLFLQISDGVARKGEMSIIQRKSEVVLRITGWFPAADGGHGAGAGGSAEPVRLRVFTATESLLVVLDDRDQVVCRYNGDHIRRWCAEYRNQLDRWREDAPDPPAARAIAPRRAARIDKHHNRIRSAVDEAAAAVIRCARRRMATHIQYDDSISTFAKPFPWHMLRDQIREKCRDARMAHEHVQTDCTQDV